MALDRRRRRIVRPPVPPRPAPHAGFVTFATLVLAGFLIWASQEVLVPVAIAVLLTFALTPLADRLRRVIGHVPAVLASVLLAILLVVGLGWAIESQFFDLVGNLDKYNKNIAVKMEHLRKSGGSMGDVSKKIQQTVDVLSPTTAPAAAQGGGGNEAGKTVLGGATNPGAPTLPNVTPQTPLPVRLYPEQSTFTSSVSTYVTALLSHLAEAFIVLVFVIFMLLGRDDLRDRMIRLAGGGGDQLDVTTRALDDAAGRVSKYLVAQLTVNAIYGLSVVVGLFVIGHLFKSGDGSGFPSIFVLGLLCGVFRFVPYLGPILGAILPLSIAFGLFGSPDESFFKSNAALFTTAGMFVCLEIVVSQFVEPLLYGDKTGMSPIAVLVSAAFWTWLWGPIGLLLSTPLTVVLVVMGRYVPSLHFLQILLGDEPALEPHARLYQRLIMLDRDEADRIAAEVLATRGLAAAYDEALLPALAAAERNLSRATLHRSQYTFVRDQIAEIGEELAIADAGESKEKAAGGNVKQAASAILAGASAIVAATVGKRDAAGAVDASSGAGTTNGASGPNDAGTSNDASGPNDAGTSNDASGPSASSAQSATSDPSASIAPSASSAQSATSDPSASIAPSASSGAGAPAGPIGPVPRPPTRILCLATGGRGDEIAGRLLQLVLERRGVVGIEVRSVRGRDHDAFEATLARIADQNEGPGDGPGVVVLSSMPPASIARARSACRRTRDVVPKERQIVGLWTAVRDVTDATRKRIDCAKESAVVYTLATAADAVEAAMRRADAAASA